MTVLSCIILITDETNDLPSLASL